jgi:hypothetical protein
MHESSREPIRDSAPRVAGVFYAATADGGELPIVDVTHPAFSVSLTEEEQRARVTAFMKEQEQFVKLPRLVRTPLMRLFLRGSLLGSAMQTAWTSYLSGMNTYLFKLGPENLSDPRVKPVDRKIAAALPGFAMRLRLCDMARLLADAARPLLAAASSERPLHLLNIAGGTAVDSLNALILLRREHPAVLEGRHVEITVLDLDTAGPGFGARALAKLVERTAPLAGLDARFSRVHYDWSNPTELVPVLEEARAAGAVTLASSEGGLFEYGSDAQILANLGTLRAGTGSEFVMVGSVTRADAPMQLLRSMSPVPTVPRGIAAFRALVERASFHVGRVIERPFSDHVVLAPHATAS